MKSAKYAGAGFLVLLPLGLRTAALYATWGDGHRFGTRADSPQSALQSLLATPMAVRQALAPVQAASSYQRQFLPTKDGPPQILLIHPLRYKDFAQLGLSRFEPAPGHDPPLELVLLKGDFDTGNFGIGQKAGFSSASFVVVVFDTEQEVIATVTVSVYGDEFKTLLAMAGEEPLPRPPAK